MMCQGGKEYNFAYIQPNHLGEPAAIAIPSALQMGWTYSTPFFCAASETVRDAMGLYADEPLSSLPSHPLKDLTMPLPGTADTRDKLKLPNIGKWTAKTPRRSSTCWRCTSMISCSLKVDQPRRTAPLQQGAAPRNPQHFPPPPAISGHNGEDPVSNKKLL